MLLVASFDLLLGYTGIVSFAHTMFFGIGAYGIAIACSRFGPTWEAIAIGTAGALALSFVLALAVGLFSLRVRAIFFAMITLAVAAAFMTMACALLARILRRSSWFARVLGRRRLPALIFLLAWGLNVKMWLR